MKKNINHRKEENWPPIFDGHGDWKMKGQKMIDTKRKKEWMNWLRVKRMS